MDRPLKEHICELENRLVVLLQSLRNGSTSQEERSRVEEDIRLATLAVNLYRKALEVEKSLSLSQVSPRIGCNSAEQKAQISDKA